MLISGLYSIDQIGSLPVGGFFVGLDELSWLCVKYFSYEELALIQSKALEANVDIYIMLNKMYQEAELTKVKEALKLAKSLAIKGVVYSSLAIYQLAKEINYCDSLIYQADTLMTNSYDAGYFASKNKCVILAKEIPLSDIEIIVKDQYEKYGMIVHGFLNMSYSRRHFLTNYFEMLGRDIDLSGNFYLQEETRDLLMPIIEEKAGTSVYTGWILESLSELSKLNNLLKYLWIDPIGMSIKEQTTTVRIYHKLLRNEISVEMAKEELPVIGKHPYHSGYHFIKTKKTKAEVDNEKD